MVRRSVWVGLLVLALVVAFNVPQAVAQAVFGSVFGTVTDPQGAGVVGAKVTVTSIAKGSVEETTTNDSGNYNVTHLIPDVYNVRIEAAGFKVFEVKNIQVSADASARTDAALTVGDVTQTVEVSGEIEQLKTDRADVAISFNEKYVEDLPILNRNFTNFELLSPGTQKLVGWSHAATENPQGGQQIFVNGQHFSGTAFELDGTDNQDPILGIIVVNPNLDAIQESKIALQNYDAEFGKAVAGVVTVQTKSGTNQFHGSGFYDYRGDGQQARDPFHADCRSRLAPGNLQGLRSGRRRSDHQGQAVLLRRLPGNAPDQRRHKPDHPSDLGGGQQLQSGHERHERHSGILRPEPISRPRQRRRTDLRSSVERSISTAPAALLSPAT